MQHKCFVDYIMTHFKNAEANKVAFTYLDEISIQEITYQQFYQDILLSAGYFKSRNIQNQHIALAASNSYEWFVAYFAILCSRNVAVLMNPDLPDYLIDWQCQKAKVAFFCTEPSVAAEERNVFKDLRVITYEDLKETAPISEEEIYRAAPEETIMLVFSSGTTGNSKAAEITSGTMWYVTTVKDPDYDSPQKQRLYFTLPAYHIAGVKFALEALSRYCTVCIGRGIRYLLQDMPRFNPTYLVLVPTMAETMVKVLRFAKDKKEQEKYIGNNLQRISLVAAPARSAVYTFLMDLGFTIEVCYGMTETTGDGLWCTFEDGHVGATGKPRGDLQCRIQNGELLMKGPSLMKGYFEDLQETQKVLEDGWIHTGDLASCKQDGYFYITGRSKNVIILSNGENVNPEEIEAQFGKCSAIQECMIYSDGKGICADVYTENKALADEYIKKYNKEMPTYRQVYKVNYSDEPLPKTGSGKIKRKENV